MLCWCGISTLTQENIITESLLKELFIQVLQAVVYSQNRRNCVYKTSIFQHRCFKAWCVFISENKQINKPQPVQQIKEIQANSSLLWNWEPSSGNDVLPMLNMDGILQSKIHIKSQQLQRAECTAHKKHHKEGLLKIPACSISVI